MRGTPAIARTACLAVALLFAVPAERAAGDELDDALARARSEAVRRLEDLAEWCASNKVVGARHRTLGKILLLDPEHARARASLQYSRPKKDGPWVQSKGYKEPADWNKDAVAESRRRLEEALRPYRNDVLAVLENAGEEGLARRDAVLDVLLGLFPDDEFVHEARGDVRDGGRWVMAETARALARRGEIREIALRARDAVPAPEVDRKHVAAGWKSAVATKSLRVIGTVEPEEAIGVAVHLEASGPFFRRVLDVDATLSSPKLVVLMRSVDEASGFYASEKSLGAAAWKEVEAAGLGGSWIPKEPTLMNWRRKPVDRLAGCVRQALNVLLNDRFHAGERAWAEEGIGHLLCRHFTGAYGPPFVRIEGTDIGAGRDELPDEDEDWMVAARETLATAEPRRLPALLTMRTNAMQASDVVMAYALAAYLVEGLPGKAAAFVEATVETDDAFAAVKKALGVPMAVLRRRLERFTREVTVR